MDTLASAGLLSGADKLIRRLGGDPDAVAKAAGTPPGLFDDTTMPVEPDAIFRFVDIAATMCDCDSFGLLLSEMQDFWILGSIWRLILSARTPLEVLQDLQRHLRLLNMGVSLSLIEDGDGVFFDVSFHPASGNPDRHILEHALGMLVRYINLRLGAAWRPSYVKLPHRRPRDMRTHFRLLGPDVLFNQERAGLHVDRQVLLLPLNGGVGEHAKIVADLKKVHRPVAETCVERVAGIIRAGIPYSRVSKDNVASQLMMSPRTLQRYLARRGTSFEHIYEAVRANMAIKYLTQSDLGMAQISDLLGYSQPNAFSRAFVRQNGVTPLRFRKDNEALRGRPD